MSNLGKCIEAVLASALRNLDPSPHQDFTVTLMFVCALVNFSLMTQHRSNTQDTVAYMQRYPQRVHHMKDSYLEFRTSKSTPVEVNRQGKELRISIANQIEQEAHHISAALRR